MTSMLGSGRSRFGDTLHGRRWRAVALLMSAAVLAIGAACEDDPSGDEDLDALPTNVGSPDISAEESNAEFVYSDTSIEPASVTVPPEGVIFTLINEGTFEHEFVLVDSEDTFELDQLPLAEGGTVNVSELTVLGEIDPFPPGETRTVTAQLEPGGRYIAFCNVPGHYQAGVRAEIEAAGE